MRRALPEAPISYVVATNPDPALLRVLVALGSRFEAASTAEVDACALAGASPAAISWGGRRSSRADIAYAYHRGVRLFACDHARQLDTLAWMAPGCSVFSPIATGGGATGRLAGSASGCDPTTALGLLLAAAGMGLDPIGVSLSVEVGPRGRAHVDAALATAALVVATGATKGLALRTVHLGGFPAHRGVPVSPARTYATAIRRSMTRHFPLTRPCLVIQASRYVAGDTGSLPTDMALVSGEPDDHPARWSSVEVGVLGRVRPHAVPSPARRASAPSARRVTA